MKELPREFLNSLKNLNGFDEKLFVEAHKDENKITSIRLNPFKKVKPEFEIGKKIPWCEDGYYLPERPSFTNDPLFHAGAYYVQETGSMFLHYALKQKIDLSESLKILDLCAAPGGKSTLINSILNKESLLVANEIVKSRASILSENLSRWGTSNTIVTNNNPEKFSELKSFFDVVIIDAPCSGSGLFRKQSEAIEEWSVEHVSSCSVRQKNILQKIIPCIKENGILFYSTCSYSEEENENIVKWLISDFDTSIEPIDVPEEWGIVKNEFGYRFYPHLTKSEGFFCTVLRKNSSGKVFYKQAKQEEISVSTKKIISGFVDRGESIILPIITHFHLMNEACKDFVLNFRRNFYFRKVGTSLGMIKGKDFVPHHELALSTKVSDEIKKLEFSKEEAISFLKKENLDVRNIPDRIYLVTYNNLGIGWIKKIQNRMNNYLPNEIRIRN